MKTDGRGKLTITGKEEGDLIVLTVADNGVGMNDEQAVKNRGLERSFKQAIPQEVYERLEKEMDEIG